MTLYVSSGLYDGLTLICKYRRFGAPLVLLTRAVGQIGQFCRIGEFC